MIQEHNTRRQVEKEKRKWYRLKKKKKGNPSNHFNESNRKIPNTKMSN